MLKTHNHRQDGKWISKNLIRHYIGQKCKNTFKIICLGLIYWVCQQNCSSFSLRPINNKHSDGVVETLPYLSNADVSHIVKKE